jgi:hypothetical protein
MSELFKKETICLLGKNLNNYSYSWTMLFPILVVPCASGFLAMFIYIDDVVFPRIVLVLAESSLWLVVQLSSSGRFEILFLMISSTHLYSFL